MDGVNNILKRSKDLSLIHICPGGPGGPDGRPDFRGRPFGGGHPGGRMF